MSSNSQDGESPYCHSIAKTMSPLFDKILKSEHTQVISLDNASEAWKESDKENHEWNLLTRKFNIVKDDKVLYYLRKFGLLPSETIASTDEESTVAKPVYAESTTDPAKAVLTKDEQIHSDPNDEKPVHISS